MSTKVEVGSSYRAHLRVYGSGLATARIREFYRSYVFGGDGKWPLLQFAHHARSGHLQLFEVVLQGAVIGRYGISYMRDELGEFVQVVFIEGLDFDLYGDVIAKVTWQAARACAPSRPRCLVKGRRGWQRLLRRRGIVMGDDGFIDGNQEAFAKWAAPEACRA